MSVFYHIRYKISKQVAAETAFLFLNDSRSVFVDKFITSTNVIVNCNINLSHFE